MTTVWLSVSDVAYLAQIPARTLYRWVADGHVQSRTVRGRDTTVDFDEVVKYANRDSKLTEPDHGI